VAVFESKLDDCKSAYRLFSYLKGKQADTTYGCVLPEKKYGVLLFLLSLSHCRRLRRHCHCHHHPHYHHHHLTSSKKNKIVWQMDALSQI